MACTTSCTASQHQGANSLTSRTNQIGDWPGQITENRNVTGNIHWYQTSLVQNTHRDIYGTTTFTTTGHYQSNRHEPVFKSPEKQGMASNKIHCSIYFPASTKLCPAIPTYKLRVLPTSGTHQAVIFTKRSNF